MKYLTLLCLLCFSVISAEAQRYITKSGHISFYSTTPIEDITANNHTVNSALDLKTGAFVFKVLMKSFEFEKALMQEHFNENFVESDKYPNAVFKGKVLDYESLNLVEGEVNNVLVEGNLTIHGVTQSIKEKGTLVLEDGRIKADSKFNLKPKDFEIKIPKAVVKNIAESVEVTVDLELKALKK